MISDDSLRNKDEWISIHSHEREVAILRAEVAKWRQLAETSQDLLERNQVHAARIEALSHAAGQEVLASASLIEAPTGQPPRAWAEQEKLGVAAAMERIVAREAWIDLSETPFGRGYTTSLDPLSMPAGRYVLSPAVAKSEGEES